MGRNTQGVILIRTAEDENVVGLQRVAEPVDDEELDAIDGSVAEGDEDIARKRKAMTTLRMTLTSNVIAVRGPDIRPFSLPLRATSFTATLVTLYLHPEAELRPFEIPCFLSNYAESLALLIQSVSVTHLALNRLCFGVLHRQCPAPAGI
ncbi:DNA gyrase subunit A [Salmonella enterica subsp. enterica]|uniref:DNA gyrase subunit A n=1 Tax=Salmonella enterica I TaxID=59201 RepID=A0A379WQ06_SALET|nr:DNA gyrase subunit A [Salmonella enterica subsp. enterica]